MIATTTPAADPHVARPEAAPLFDALEWDDRFVRELPGDPSTDVFPRPVPGAAWSAVSPTPVAAPVLIGWSAEVATGLGLPAEPDAAASTELADVLAGNRLTAGMAPYAARYGGHQFGNWAGQLGDGRAIALGEVVDTDGVNQTLQLKGAGPTPYSRRADGRAVLRSSIREFLCSEAMHHLGVPTTRALSLVLTGDTVVRDMFYDGNPEAEPGAIVCRVAPSFLRMGSFELPAAQGEDDLLRSLVDFTLTHDYPHLGAPTTDTDRRDLTVEMFSELCRRTADLMIDWMRVGFVHGVMNTDNLSTLGLTIDYGPYGWLEDFNPGWTPNTTDASGRRYRYGHQVGIGQWNLARFGGALLGVVGDETPLQAALGEYATRAEDGWWTMWATKLGLVPDTDEPVPAADRQLIDDLLELLTRTETDMTIFFRSLPDVATLDDGVGDRSLVAPVLDAYYIPEELDGDVLDDAAAWLRRWRDRIGKDDVRDRMDAVNPRYVLRNYLAQEAIDASAGGDHTLIGELLDTLRQPYTDQAGRDRFAARRPDWARTRPGCSMLSCSS